MASMDHMSRGADLGRSEERSPQSLKAVSITIDGEEFEIEDRTQTPDELLALAVSNPDQHYLIKVKNKKQISFQGRGGEGLRVHKGDAFVTVFMGPTTVSELPAQMGAAHFRAGLELLGYEVTDLGGGKLSFPYEVEAGAMQGEVVTLAFNVPADFPFSPPSGPHVKPHVHQIGGGGTHPKGGVHYSTPHGGPSNDFQYWSRPFPNWATSRKTVGEYMAFIRHLWATQ